MKDIALIFPGQGAQKVGMGREFYESSAEAKAVFDQADAVLGNGLKSVMFDGPEEKLLETAYTQPAIFTMSVAALRAFQAHPKYKNITPKFAAGLSLGEYSALTACGVLTLEEALKLIDKRASYMDEATKIEPGKMAAIMKLTRGQVEEVCVKTGAEVANFNSNQQIVITGHADRVDESCELFKGIEGSGVIPLNVSGAFHSSLMRPAANKFKDELANAVFKPAAFPVLSNVDAIPTTDISLIQANLSAQITSSVQWVDTVLAIAKAGVTDFIEIGPGKVLKGLIRRIDRDLTVHNIEKPEDIENLPF
jgi:[acyl-carrier-protein] S-malonyltransferase